MRNLPLLLLLACNGSPTDDSLDTDETGDTGIITATLAVPELVRLPVVDSGGPAPTAPLVIAAVGSLEAMSIDVDGPFTVAGDLAVLIDEERTLTVRFTGDLDAPAAHVGTATITGDGHVHEVTLAAVVADPALPDAVTWTDDGLGLSAFVPLPSAPYPTDSGSWTDPTVWVRIPAGLTAPFASVTHLHGHNAVLADMLSSKQLPELFAAAGRNAVVIVPQGPVSAASGDFGKLMEAGGHAALVRDVVALGYREGLIDIPAADGVVLTSHSGGYRATSAIIQQGGLSVDQVHLYDSLYAESASFEAFARAGGVLRSNYTPSGGTGTLNQALAATLSDAFTVGTVFSDGALRSEPVLIGWTAATHSAVMSDERNMQRWLEAALPPDTWAPPLLVDASSDGTTTVVTWRDEGVEVTVEGSADGTTWTTLGTGTGGTASVDARPWLRLRYGEGAPSDAYPGDGTDWLVVDGFDRILGGSYTERTHPFAAWVAAGLPAASGASNEAIAEGLVDLSDYSHVVWLLGDESSADRTFTDAERTALTDYVSGGGKLLLSGAELGFASDRTWLAALGIGYAADDAGTTLAGGWRFGVAYDEDYPDVLTGDATLWSYDTGGAAAVRTGSVIAVGFGLETLHPDDRDAALAELVGAFP